MRPATIRAPGLLCVSLGCGPGDAGPTWTAEAESEARALEARLEQEPPRASGEVRIQLAFGAAADLDLYVTGPLEETVYYANSPSRIGGELLEDRRCTHEGPRVETTRFLPARPGAYRVGVDYAHACGERRPVPFALRIDRPEGALSSRGLASHHVFDPVVLEFTVEPEESQP